MLKVIIVYLVIILISFLVGLNIGINQNNGKSIKDVSPDIDCQSGICDPPEGY